MSQTVGEKRVNEIVALLEAIQPMRDELKRCTMIYQYDEKLAAARAFDKPFAYFDVVYRRWARYQKLLHRKQEWAMEECLKAGMPDDMPPSKFPLYRKLLGLDRQVPWN